MLYKKHYKFYYILATELQLIIITDIWQSQAVVNGDLM